MHQLTYNVLRLGLRLLAYNKCYNLETKKNMKDIKFRALVNGKIIEWEEMLSSKYFKDFFALKYMTNPPKPVAKLIEFTGRIDKNGKEIYEGDILSVDGKQMTVFWDNENLQWAVKGNPELELWYVLDDGPDSFVIGSIYDTQASN